MKAVKLAVITLVASMALSGLALAKDMKMAYVDLSKVFDGYQKTKDFDVALQKEAKSFSDERDGMINKIKDGQSKLALMKDSEKQKLNDDLDQQKNKLVEYDKQKRAELAQKRDEKVRQILQEIQKLVEGIAKKEGYTFIFNDRVLVYGDQTMNITDQVLKALNDSTK